MSQSKVKPRQTAGLVLVGVRGRELGDTFLASVWNFRVIMKARLPCGPALCFFCNPEGLGIVGGSATALLPEVKCGQPLAETNSLSMDIFASAVIVIYVTAALLLCLSTHAECLSGGGFFPRVFSFTVAEA